MSKKFLYISTTKLTAACCGLLLVVFCTIGMSFRPVYDENEEEEIVMSGPRRSHWHWVESGCVSDTHHYKSSKDYAQTQVQTMGNGIATISTEETTNVTSPASGSPRVTSTTAVAGNTASISWNSGLEHDDQETGYDAGTIAAAHKKTFTLTATPADPDEYYFAGWGTSTSESSINNNDNPRVIVSDMGISGYTDTSGDNQPANYATNTYTEKYYAFFKPRVPVDITLMPDPNGSISYSYKNVPTTTVSGETTFNTKYDVTLMATPNEGYVFFGWYTLSGSTENYISYANPNTRAYKENITIYAKFIPATQAIFNIKGTEQYYYDLNRAASEASTSSSKIVYPIKDGTVPAGNYTIPSGVTLVIPCNSAINKQTTPTIVHYTKYANAPVPSPYRKLTFREGANITIASGGAICVGGQIASVNGGNPSGFVTGPCGVIDMSAGGHIEVNSNATLYVWGFIKGQDMDQGNNTIGVGTITANAGSNVWEDLAFGDWRGGSACSSIADTRFFPFQSYFAQNIEVPLTINYGATDNCYSVVFASDESHPVGAKIIGNAGLFKTVDSESVVRKWYDPTTDLICYELSGTANLDAITVSGLPLVGSISSSEFDLPISSNMHIILTNSSVTLSKPMILQPGAKVEIKNDANITIASGVNVYLYDKDDWGLYVVGTYFRSYRNLTIHKNRGDGSSKELLDDAQFIVDGQLTINGKLYSTTGGADIMGNGGGKVVFSTLPSKSTTIDAFTSNGDQVSGGVTVNTANLHNEDNSYTQSIASTTFHNVNGRWFAASAKDEKSNHTYDFTYISSGAVSGTGGTSTTTDAVYSWDKTGLEARQKWFNVTADECANWWHGQGEQSSWFYNWTLNSDWHQFMPTATEGMYSGSNNTLYTKSSCTWEELGSTDVNCLYTIGGVKKALVEGEFIALDPNNNDPAYHAADDANQYYICFEGCNWHAADKYTEEEKAYIIAPDTFIWYDNAWMSVNFQKPFAYTMSETNVPIYYEYLNGEWVLAEPYVRVVDGTEDRSYYFIEDAFKFANSVLRNAPTITILRDYSRATTPVSYIGANKTCTLDLNGHTLELEVAGAGTSEVKMFNINASGTTFTITDNSDDAKGELRLIAAPNTAKQSKRWHGVFLTDGTLVLNAGKVYVEDNFKYTSTSDAGMVSGITIAAGKTFTMNGGSIDAYASYNAMGVQVNGAAGVNASVKIKSGTIHAQTTEVTSAYGMYIAGGTTTIIGGKIEARTKTTTAIGVATVANKAGYYGTLNMTGGEIDAISTTTTAYGVQVGEGIAYSSGNVISNRVQSQAVISGGTIRATSTTTKSSSHTVGVRSFGTTNIIGGTIECNATQSIAYGVYAVTGTTTVSGNPMIIVRAPTQSYGACAGLTPADKTGVPYNGHLEISGGKFDVAATTSTLAYGVLVQALGRAINYTTKSGYYPGNYVSAGSATISGGEFDVQARTTTVYGIFVKGALTQNGAKLDADGNIAPDVTSAPPICSVTGGKFKMSGTGSVFGTNNAADIANYQIAGGYYSHDGNLEAYAVAPKHAVALQETDANYDPYFYQVVESYNVTFKNGETQLQSGYQEVGKSPVYEGDAPTKASTTTASYVFDGWSTTDGGALVSPLPTLTSAGATYYAHFAETTLKYMATFDAKTNGGNEDAQVIYVEPSAGVGTLPTATKTGYTFNGWYTAASGGTKITSATVPTGDVTYFAQFTVNKYTLTWELEGGTVSTAGKYGSTSWPAKNATGAPSVAVPYGSALTAPAVTKTGYTFVNWGGAVAATMPAEPLTYTAVWRANTNTKYTVKHYLQNVDGTYPTEPTETEALTGTTDESVTPEVKEYEGFTSPAAQTVTIAANGSLVVEYRYARRHYTFTLDAYTNGGTSEVPSIEVLHGATIGAVPPDAQKGCNDFTGWYTKPVGGVKITPEFVIEYDMKTLYAQFSDDVRTYPITYNAGANGTGTVAGGTKTCGVNTTLSSSTFTRTGYTQTGWSLTDDGAQAYALGAPYTDNDALTLYPFWTINTHKLAWNLDGGVTSSTTHTAAGNAVAYGTAITYPADNTMTKANCIFSGWSTDATTMPDADLTITAQWTPAVASVTIGGATTYYATLQEAFDYAADKTTPTITLLQDVSGLTKQQKYTNTSNTTVTFDLNGHSIEGNVNGFLYLTSDANSGTFNIVDNSAEQTGMVKNVMSYNGTRYCMYAHQGTVNLKGGTIYMQNTNTGTSVCAEAVSVRSSRKFNMTGGQIEVHSTRSAYAVYTSGTTKLSGGKIIANETSRGNCAAVHTVNGTTTISGDIECEATGTNNVYGAMVGGATPGTDGTLYKGTLVIDGGSFAVEATGASGVAYGAYCTANTRAIDYADNATKAGNYADAGTLTIKNGEFTIKGATTYGVGTKAAVSTQNAQDADGLKTTYAKATATPKTTITGGKFDIQGTTKAAVNTTATAANLLIQGGWYSDATNLATKYTAPAKDCNYHVLPLEGENPYKYEVAEAYTVTFNANGHGTAPEAQVVKDGQKATEPSPLSETGYTFGGWYKEEACTNQWDFATATVTAAQTLYAKWTAIEYTITFDTNGGSEVASIKQDFGSAVTAPANPTRTGYTFAGWLPDVPATMPVDGANCVAQWSIDTYNISYTLDGGTVASANPATYNVETATFTLNNPTKEGYTFLGWTGSNGETPQSTVSIAKGSTGDKSYTANWVVNVAAVTVGGETTYYASIAEAWEFVNDQTANTTIKLLQDANTTESLVFTPAAAMTCTLDMNNHTLSGAVSKLIDINLAGSTFVIDDSSDDKNGKILAEYSVNARLYAIYLTKGTLNLKAGHIHSKNPHTYSSASGNKNSAATGVYVTAGQTFTMDGGTVESESQYNSIAIFASESGTTPITINGGRVYGHTTASTSGIGIYTYAKGLTVNGGTIIGHAYTSTAYGIYVRGGSATLKGGRIEATNDTTSSKGSTTAYGIYARGPITIPATSTVDVYAQARTNTAYAVCVYAGITGNTIAGGTFTAKAKTGKTAGGIYSAGNITVTGGTFTATTKTTGAYGIYSVRGTVTVNGDPTFNVTAGSTTAYGAYAYGTIGNNGKGKYSGTININGGTFNVTSTKENAWGAYAALVGKTVKLVVPENADDTIAGTHYMPGFISVTDGTFNVKAKTTAAYGIVVAAAKSESGAVGTTTRIPIATITGGKFKVESAGDDNATAYAMNSSATATNLKVQGGWYNTEKTNASSKPTIGGKYTAPTKACNYHVLDLPEEELPYKYKVAEAYNLTWDAAGGELSGLYTSGYTAVGDPITVPTATRTDYDFSGWNESPAATMPASDKTYTATWTFAETGDYVDIVDWTSNGDGTGTLTINANGWAASGWPNTINGTSYVKEDRADDRTLTIPYEGAAGTNLQIKVESGGSTTSLHNYKIPYINTTEGAGEEDVVYVNEGTLTISSNTTLAALYIRPEASVEVTSGTLTVGKLVMRTLPWQAAAISGNFTASETWYTRIAPNKRTITGPYAPITYESARYYQFALPRACTAKLKDIQVSNAANTPYGNTWLLKRYNEETRAEKGIGEANWVALGNEEYIQGGVGYEMFSNSNYYREFYFPLGAVSSASLGNTTAVSYDMGAAGEKHAGWNWVSSPLMSVYDNSDADPEEGMKIGILMTDGSYDQGVPEYIYPAIPFSYQASEGQSVISFEGSSIVAAAPQRRAAADESVRKQWIHVNIQDEDGIGDHTSILAHPTRYEQTYKTGIDVAKQSFTASRPLIYSSHTYGEMAFAAVADSLLEIGIPLTVYSPKPQELTISMRDNNWLDRLAEVWLVDMETDAQTDLFDSDYTFEATEGTTRGRIFLMGRFKAPNIATDIETTEANEDQNMKAQKLIIRDKLYIRLNGQLYDATGKLVNDK